MKEVYCRGVAANKEFVILSDGEPYAKGTFFGALNKGDVVLAKASNANPNTEFFFSDIGASAFCDDNMPGRGFTFPCRIISLPEGSKQYCISPVIAFTGMLVHSEFVPGFSRYNAFIPFSVSKKIEKERALSLSEKFEKFCSGITFSCYRCSFVLRTLCGEKDVTFDAIQAEIEAFVKRFEKVLETAYPSHGKEPAPGTVLFKNNLPGYLISAYKISDYKRVYTDDASDSLDFMQVFKALPAIPEVVTRPNIDRLFDIVPGLMKLPSYLGRTFYTPGGARITYDKTEAMHVFDINSGESKESYKDINLECCEIIARVISVRNLGGIIMCDFINMRSREDEAEVIDKMKELASQDYKPFKVYGFTALKVLECSRNR